MQHDLQHHCPTSVLLVNELNYVSKRKHQSWLVSGKGSTGGVPIKIRQGTHCTGKTGKMTPTKSLSGKTQEILKLCQNTGNLVCSSCKFPDSKGKRYFNICRKIPFFGGSWISLPSQFCVCNSHKSRKLTQGKFSVGQGKLRECENVI